MAVPRHRTGEPGSGGRQGRDWLFQGLLPIERARIPAEAIAGVTLAALAIPEVMGYTAIAGMPVITGLYTILLPLIVFAVLGSSRHLVVGADSATAAILAAGLAGMAVTGSEEYVALAGMLALLAGGFLLAARLLRLGFLADFLSRSVLIGFLSGVGVQVAVRPGPGHARRARGPGGEVHRALDALGATRSARRRHWPCPQRRARDPRRLAGSDEGAVGAHRGRGRDRRELVADLAARRRGGGGRRPGGLPSLGVPDVAADDIPGLLRVGVSIFIVILAQSAATSRAYATSTGPLQRERRPRRAGLREPLGRSLGHVRRQREPDEDRDGRQRRRPQPARPADRRPVVVIALLFLTGPLRTCPPRRSRRSSS